MFTVNELKNVIDLQDRSYRLLLWVNENLKKGALRFDVVHDAMSASEAAREWLARHSANIPAKLRPAPDELGTFAHLFSSFLMTSFELCENPGMRRASDRGCGCPLCSFLVVADHLKVKKVTDRTRRDARALKTAYLQSVAKDLGVERVPDQIEDLIDRTGLARDVSLATYAHELVRRSAYASQGAGILALWREIAWTAKPKRRGAPGQLHPDAGFRLTHEDVLAAEARIVAAMKGPARAGEAR